MPRWVLLQKSKQLFGWNRRPVKRMRLTVSFMLNAKEYYKYSRIPVCSKNECCKHYDVNYADRNVVTVLRLTSIKSLRNC